MLLSCPCSLVLGLIGAGLPIAACRRSLSGPVDVPVLADVVTIAFYVLAMVCLGVSLPQTLQNEDFRRLICHVAASVRVIGRQAASMSVRAKSSPLNRSGSPVVLQRA